MYLILPKEEALVRNNQEAIKRGCTPPTVFWWSWDQLTPDTVWMSVGDGDGLTEEELNMCVENLPIVDK